MLSALSVEGGHILRVAKIFYINGSLIACKATLAKLLIAALRGIRSVKVIVHDTRDIC